MIPIRLFEGDLIRELVENSAPEDMLSQEYVPFSLELWAKKQGLESPRWEDVSTEIALTSESEYQIDGIPLEFVEVDGEFALYAGVAARPENPLSGEENPGCTKGLCYWMEVPVFSDGVSQYWDTLTLLMLLFPNPLR